MLANGENAAGVFSLRKCTGQQLISEATELIGVEVSEKLTDEGGISGRFGQHTEFLQFVPDPSAEPMRPTHRRVVYR